MLMSTSTRNPEVLARLELLCRNCNLGKYRHFSAASRAKHFNDYLGVPVVAINIVLGSVFFIALTQELPAVAKWTGGFLALAAALISGITTFFNFGKQFEGHRGIGNKYMNLAAKCETTIARYRDGLVDLTTLDGLLEELQKRYNEISDEAKPFATSESDFRSALQNEELRVESNRERRLATAASSISG